MSFFAYDRNGATHDHPDRATMQALLDSLSTIDPEHPDVSLTHDSGWCLSVFSGGLVILENVETGEGPWHQQGLSVPETLDLWIHLADGDVGGIRAGHWLEGYE